jgi:hypothetical protein
MNRKQLTDKNFEKALAHLAAELAHQLQEKGYGTAASIHELSGLLTEEYHEVLHEVHENNHSALIQELSQLGVTCLFGIACLEAETLDW